MTFINWIAFFFGGFGFFFCEINVFEERSGTGFFERIGKFVVADFGNDFADAFGTKIGDVFCGDEALDGVVEWARHFAFL